LTLIGYGLIAINGICCTKSKAPRFIMVGKIATDFPQALGAPFVELLDLSEIGRNLPYLAWSIIDLNRRGAIKDAKVSTYQRIQML